MSEKFFILACILLAVPAVLGAIMAIAVAIPDITAKIAVQAQRRNFLSLLTGMAIFAAFAALGRFIAALAPFVVILFVALLLIGLPAAAENLGRRIFFHLRGVEATRFAAIVAGWLAYAFGAMVPFVGWFLILPYIPFVAVGSVVISLISRGDVKSPASAGPLSPTSGE